MTKKIQSYYDKNKIFLYGLAVVLFFQIKYLMDTTVNLPVMDYWTYLNAFAEKCFHGSISSADLWANFTSHRAPFQYLCYIISLLHFDGNSLVGIYAGCVISGMVCLLIYKLMKKCLGEGKLAQISTLLMLVIFLNFNRWEIITLEFSLAFAVRIGLYFFVFHLIDNWCLLKEKYYAYLWEIGVFIFVTILFFSSSYFPGMVLAIAAAMFFEFIRTRDILFFKKSIGIGLFVVLATGVYLYDLNMGISSGNTEIFSVSFLISLVKGSLIMLASSICHVSILEKMDPYYYLLGGIVMLFYIVAMLLFWKRKYYKITYIPLMLMLYSLGIIATVCFARGAENNLLYLASSRYTYETGMGLLGVAFVCILEAADWFKNRRKDCLKRYILSVVILCGVLGGIIFSAKVEWDVAPYRKIYMENLQEMALHIDAYSDEELAGFQANSPELVRDGIELMKKYELGIFKY